MATADIDTFTQVLSERRACEKNSAEKLTDSQDTHLYPIGY